MSRSQRRFDLPSTEPGAVADGPSVTDELMGVPSRPAPAAAPVPASRLQEYERPRRTPARRPAPARARKEKETLRQAVPADLMNRLRGAVAACKYRDRDRLFSLNVAMEVAIREFVERAEDQYNNGEPFPWNDDDRL
jgi:hypothetical protein